MHGPGLSHSSSNSHDHTHGGAHGPDRGDNARRMLYALLINIVMVLLAVGGALLTNSLALFAEAGHVLSDVLAIGLGIGAAKVAARPPGGRGTFGMGRVEILAALINGLLLVAVAVFVAIEAIGRLSDPPVVKGAGVLLFGVLELAGNALATWILVRGKRDDVNLEAVLRHSFVDAVGAFGVVVAGLAIMITGWNLIDPIVGLAISVLILLSSWRLIREPVEVLLERAPQGLVVDEVGQAIASVKGVREVHDLHIWSITSGFPALAAHVTVSATCEVNETRRAIERMLDADFGLTHTTLQVVAEELLQLDD